MKWAKLVIDSLVNVAARLYGKLGEFRKKQKIMEMVGCLRPIKNSLRNKFKKVMFGVFFVEVLKKSS